VDLGIIVPPTYEEAYFSSIRITTTLVTVGISTAASGLMLGTFLRDDINPHVAYPLTPLVDDVAGWIAFGKHIPVGTEDYRFSSYADSGLESRTVRVVDTLPVKQFVRFGGRPDKYVDQLVRLRAGAAVLIEQDDVDPQKIIVKLKPALKHNFLGPCNEVATKDTCGVSPIRQLAGVCPDENGKITIRFE
jgi:hypothetical protein